MLRRNSRLHSQGYLRGKGKPFVYPKVQKETVPGREGELQEWRFTAVRLPGLMAHQGGHLRESGQTLIIST